MKRLFLAAILTGILSIGAHSQLAVVKMVGKNAGNSNIGFGVFAFWDFPLNEIGNRSLMVELFDFSYFEPKDSRPNPVAGYVSIKLGYKYIFSQENKTGFYIEPSAGWARVINIKDFEGANYGDGIALAAEAGYTLEIGRRNNNLNFGLKFERDIASGVHKVSSVGFRVSYAFHMFRKKED